MLECYVRLRETIIVHEIPYQVSKARLIEKIAELEAQQKMLEKEQLDIEERKKDKEIEIIYIQPSPKKPKEVKDKCDEVKCIYFKTIAKLLEKKDSELAKRFAESYWDTQGQ